MLTLFHCSDLHFGPGYQPVVGEALLAAAWAHNPDVIVASGDFTMRAKREQFQAARAYLDRMPPVPIVVTPGNHDVPLFRVLERAFRPYVLYRQYISNELDSLLVLPGAVIVSLNSTAPLRALVNGRIARSQLEFAARAFRHAAPDAARILVAHHHFAPAPDYEGGEVMPEAKRAMDLFARLRVDLVLGGHLHRAYIGNSLDVYPGTDREHGVIIVECGTSTSRRGRAREREKNSFNLIRVGDEVVRITHHMFFEEATRAVSGEGPGFEPISRHIFPRSGRAHLRDAGGAEDVAPAAGDVAQRPARAPDAASPTPERGD
ncbi:MAG TPA: metallophosphoesterase family protein [Longimicrobiales bacterium]